MNHDGRLTDSILTALLFSVGNFFFVELVVNLIVFFFFMCPSSVGIEVDGDISDSDGEWKKQHFMQLM